MVLGVLLRKAQMRIGLRTLCVIVAIILYITHPPPKTHIFHRHFVLPCEICTNAVLFEIKSPSSNSTEFIQKAPRACFEATKNTYLQLACEELLTTYAFMFVLEQRRGISVLSMCSLTGKTNCGRKVWIHHVG